MSYLHPYILVLRHNLCDCSIKYRNFLNIQNIFLIASKSKSKNYSFSNESPELDIRLKKFWRKEITSELPILTDDFAPVDYYIGAVQSQLSKSHMKNGLWSKVERFLD